MMKKELLKSKNMQHTIRMSTSHPDGDAYDGVVLGLSKSIIVFQDVSDFKFEGVSILPRKWLTKIRDSKFEKCYDKILRLHDEIQNLNRKKWVNELTSIKSAIKVIHSKEIWPAIEVFDGKKKTAMFLGPITEIHSKKFSIFAYDATGKWEKEYYINYSEVFCIQLFNQYTDRFNKYMKAKNKKF